MRTTYKVGSLNIVFQKSEKTRYITKTMHAFRRYKLCNDAVNSSLSFSNFTRPRRYTPDARFNDARIMIMLSHVVNTLKPPYSSVVSSLEKIGVVRSDMAFCKKPHITNHNDAFACCGIDLYFPSNLCTIY